MCSVLWVKEIFFPFLNHFHQHLRRQHLLLFWEYTDRLFKQFPLLTKAWSCPVLLPDGEVSPNYAPLNRINLFLLNSGINTSQLDHLSCRFVKIFVKSLSKVTSDEKTHNFPKQGITPCLVYIIPLYANNFLQFSHAIFNLGDTFDYYGDWFSGFHETNVGPSSIHYLANSLDCHHQAHFRFFSNHLVLFAFVQAEINVFHYTITQFASR